MSVKLSDLSEEDRALIMQEAKEKLSDKNSDKVYADQVKYIDKAISDFVADAQSSDPNFGYLATSTSDKVRPFISYLMKMILVTKYQFPSNCLSRAKTPEQLDDYKWILHEVMALMYKVISGGTNNE